MYSYSIAVHFALTGTFCGVFRRQALDRGAMALKVDKIVTGQLAASNILSIFKYNVIVHINECYCGFTTLKNGLVAIVCQ